MISIALNELKRRVIRKLRQTKAQPSVVVLPDLFIDHLISYELEFHAFLRKIQSIAKQGGGNLVSPNQRFQIGGNAANMASQLDSLGAQVRLIARTSRIGKAMVQLLWKGNQSVLANVAASDKTSVTTAIEFLQNKRRVNVMLSDPESASCFSPDFLREGEWRAIERADCVCVTNWNLNLDGTALAKAVFTRAHQRGRARTFLDIGDPSTRSGSELRKLSRSVLRKGLVDILSANENEALALQSTIGVRVRSKRKSRILKSAQDLQEAFRCRVNLHTHDFSASIETEETCELPTFRVKPLRVTGAGDAWNGASVYGEFAGLDSTERLLLANAAAGYYVSSPTANHPTKQNLLRFLKTHN